MITQSNFLTRFNAILKSPARKLFNRATGLHSKSSVLIPSQIRGLSFPSKQKVGKECLPEHYIEIAKREDFRDILRMLRDNFFMEEPVIAALNLPPDAIDFLLIKTIENLLEGTSLVAKAKNSGAILGVAVNVKSCPWDPDRVDKCCQEQCCNKLKDLLKFWSFMMRAPNLWQKYFVGEYFEITLLSTLGCIRGGGLGSKLLACSRRLGRDLGYHLIRVDATNYFTSLMCQSQEMEEVFRISYDLYQDANGKKCLRVDEPHKYAITYLEEPFR